MEKVSFDIKLDNSKIIEELKNDESIKELNLSDEQIKNNISLLLSYLSFIKPCLNCISFDGCKQNPKGYTVKIKKDDLFLEQVICPCKLGNSYVQEMKKILYSSYDKEKILNNKYKALFKTFLLENVTLFNDDTQKRMYQIIKGESNSGLFLQIQDPIARNNAILCFTNVLLKRVETIAIIKMSDFIRDVILDYNKIDDELMNKIMKASCLLIDDLGNEKISSTSRDEILISILDYRKLYNLQTIITSQYSIEELKSIYCLKANDSVKANLVYNKIKDIQF